MTMRLRRDTGELPTDADQEFGGGVAVLDPPAERPRKPIKRVSRLQAILQFELTTKKVPRRELMHFSRQMAVFMKAGIPILEAIDGITEEMGHKRFKETLDDVRLRLVAGDTFAGACAAHPEAFPNFYVGMLRTAELS